MRARVITRSVTATQQSIKKSALECKGVKRKLNVKNIDTEDGAVMAVERGGGIENSDSLRIRRTSKHTIQMAKCIYTV